MRSSALRMRGVQHACGGDAGHCWCWVAAALAAGATWSGVRDRVTRQSRVVGLRDFRSDSAGLAAGCTDCAVEVCRVDPKTLGHRILRGQ